MYRVILLALLLCLSVTGLLQGETTSEETVTEEEASLLTPANKALTLKFDAVFDEKNPRSIQEEISVDLIDLDALRAAIEAHTAGRELRLGLKDCIKLTLQQNPDILISSIDPQAADADAYSAKGEFDPMWQTRTTYTYTSVTASKEIQQFGGISAVESYVTNLESSFLGKLTTGTQYALAFSLNKEENTYGSFIEDFDGRMALTLTQPLLRGFGRTVNTIRIQAARNLSKISAEQLRLQTMQTVSEVVKAYWDLVTAVENVTVQQESLDNAERLLRINETRQEIGTAADIDVLQAKAGVATRQSELISARARVNDAADVLKQLLDMQEEGYFSKAVIIPTDRPSIDTQVEMLPENMDAQVQESIEKALQHRPEVEIMGLQIENAELEEMSARNDMLPELNLTGMYGQGGRNHKVRQMLYGIRDKDHEFYSYGFEANIPIGNRAARGAHTKAKLNRRQAELQKHKTLQGLMFNVHLAARNLFTNRILVESNRQARRLQEANVIAEEKRLRLGVTTSWQVLRIQEDLTAAQTMEVQALTAYEKARIDLGLAEGTLLDELDITLDFPEIEKTDSYLESIRPRWE